MLTNMSDNSINRFSSVNIDSSRSGGYDAVKPVMSVNGFVIFNKPLCDAGIIRFIDKKHAKAFFSYLQKRCEKENMSVLFNNLKDNRYNKLREDNLYINLANLEPDSTSSGEFRKIQKFKKIISHTHKITMPKKVVQFSFLGNTEFKNWPPAEQKRFIKFCKLNMSKAQYAKLNKQIGSSDLALPAYDKFEVWLGEVNIVNPGKVAAEIRKNIAVGPLYTNREALSKWVAPHTEKIAQGKLSVVWMYVDNATDNNGVLIPNICLIPNNNTSKDYADALKYKHFVYHSVHDMLSPEGVKRICGKIDEFNLPEKVFSQLDLAILPALASIPFAPARNTLIEIYGIFATARQLPNPVSWVRFVASFSRIDIDVKDALKIWNYGTSIERSLLLGQVLGLCFGPKLLKNVAIEFQGLKCKIVSKNGAKPGAYFFADNPDGTRTVITDKGDIYVGKFDPEKGLTVKKVGRAPKVKRPKVTVTSEKTSPIKKAQKNLPGSRSLPVPAKKPAPKAKPAAERRPAPRISAQPQPAYSKSSSRASAPVKSVPVSMAGLAKIAGKLNPFEVVSSALENFKTMVTDAAGLMAMGINNIASGTGGLTPAVANGPAMPNLPGIKIDQPGVGAPAQGTPGVETPATPTRLPMDTTQNGGKAGKTSEQIKNELTAELQKLNADYAALENEKEPAIKEQEEALRNQANSPDGEITPKLKNLTTSPVGIIFTKLEAAEKQYGSLIEKIFTELDMTDRGDFLHDFILSCPKNILENQASTLAFLLANVVIERIGRLKTLKDNPRLLDQYIAECNNIFKILCSLETIPEDRLKPIKDKIPNVVPQFRGVDDILRSKKDEIINEHYKHILTINRKDKSLSGLLNNIPGEVRNSIPEEKEPAPQKIEDPKPEKALPPKEAAKQPDGKLTATKPLFELTREYVRMNKNEFSLAELLGAFINTISCGKREKNIAVLDLKAGTAEIEGKTALLKIEVPEDLSLFANNHSFITIFDNLVKYAVKTFVQEIKDAEKSEDAANLKKLMDKNYQIEIKVELYQNPETNRLEIKIIMENNGPGVKPEDKAAVFVGETNSELKWAKEQVAHNGGKISECGEFGKGAKIVIIFNASDILSHKYSPREGVINPLLKNTDAGAADRTARPQDTTASEKAPAGGQPWTEKPRAEKPQKELSARETINEIIKGDLPESQREAVTRLLSGIPLPIIEKLRSAGFSIIIDKDTKLMANGCSEFNESANSIKIASMSADKYAEFKEVIFYEIFHAIRHNISATSDAEIIYKQIINRLKDKDKNQAGQSNFLKSIFNLQKKDTDIFEYGSDKFYENAAARLFGYFFSEKLSATFESQEKNLFNLMKDLVSEFTQLDRGGYGSGSKLTPEKGAMRDPYKTNDPINRPAGFAFWNPFKKPATEKDMALSDAAKTAGVQLPKDTGNMPALLKTINEKYGCKKTESFCDNILENNRTSKKSFLTEDEAALLETTRDKYRLREDCKDELTSFLVSSAETIAETTIVLREKVLKDAAKTGLQEHHTAFLKDAAADIEKANPALAAKCKEILAGKPVRKILCVDRNNDKPSVAAEHFLTKESGGSITVESAGTQANDGASRLVIVSSEKQRTESIQHSAKELTGAMIKDADIIFATNDTRNLVLVIIGRELEENDKEKLSGIPCPQKETGNFGKDDFAPLVNYIKARKTLYDLFKSDNMRDPYGNPGDTLGRRYNDGRRNDLAGQLNEHQQAGAAREGAAREGAEQPEKASEPEKPKATADENILKSQPEKASRLNLNLDKVNDFYRQMMEILAENNADENEVFGAENGKLEIKDFSKIKSVNDMADLESLVKLFNEANEESKAIMRDMQSEYLKSSDFHEKLAPEEQKLNAVIFGNFPPEWRSAIIAELKKLPPYLLEIFARHGWFFVYNGGMSDKLSTSGKPAVCDLLKRIIVLDSSLGNNDNINFSDIIFHEVCHAFLHFAKSRTEDCPESKNLSDLKKIFESSSKEKSWDEFFSKAFSAFRRLRGNKEELKKALLNLVEENRAEELINMLERINCDLNLTPQQIDTLRKAHDTIAVLTHACRSKIIYFNQYLSFMPDLCPEFLKKHGLSDTLKVLAQKTTALKNNIDALDRKYKNQFSEAQADASKMPAKKDFREFNLAFLKFENEIKTINELIYELNDKLAKIEKTETLPDSVSDLRKTAEEFLSLPIIFSINREYIEKNKSSIDLTHFMLAELTKRDKWSKTEIKTNGDILLKAEIKTKKGNPVKVTVRVPKNSILSAEVQSLIVIIDNLISNSLGIFDQQKGDEINIVIGVDKNNVTFDISDNGPGIEPERKQTIFELGGSTKNGMGYGLWWVKNLVEAHGGTIRECGEFGKGARFVIEFPRKSINSEKSANTDNGAQAETPAVKAAAAEKTADPFKSIFNNDEIQLLKALNSLITTDEFSRIAGLFGIKGAEFLNNLYIFLEEQIKPNPAVDKDNLARGYGFENFASLEKKVAELRSKNLPLKPSPAKKEPASTDQKTNLPASENESAKKPARINIVRTPDELPPALRARYNAIEQKINTLAKECGIACQALSLNKNYELSLNRNFVMQVQSCGQNNPALTNKSINEISVLISAFNKLSAEEQKKSPFTPPPQGKLEHGKGAEALPPEKGVMRDPYGNPGDTTGRSGNDGRKNDLVGQLNERQQAGAAREGAAREGAAREGAATAKISKPSVKPKQQIELPQSLKESRDSIIDKVTRLAQEINFNISGQEGINSAIIFKENNIIALALPFMNALTRQGKTTTIGEEINAYNAKVKAWNKPQQGRIKSQPAAMPENVDDLTILQSRLRNLVSRWQEGIQFSSKNPIIFFDETGKIKIDPDFLTALDEFKTNKSKENFAKLRFFELRGDPAAEMIALADACNRKIEEVIQKGQQTVTAPNDPCNPALEKIREKSKEFAPAIDAARTELTENLKSAKTEDEKLEIIHKKIRALYDEHIKPVAEKYYKLLRLDQRLKDTNNNAEKALKGLLSDGYSMEEIKNILSMRQEIGQEQIAQELKALQRKIQDFYLETKQKFCSQALSPKEKAADEIIFADISGRARQDLIRITALLPLSVIKALKETGTMIFMPEKVHIKGHAAYNKEMDAVEIEYAHYTSLDKLARAMYHEVFHAIIKKFKNIEKIYNNLSEMILARSQMPEITDSKFLQKFLAATKTLYVDSRPHLKPEEANKILCDELISTLFAYFYLSLKDPEAREELKVEEPALYPLMIDLFKELGATKEEIYEADTAKHENNIQNPPPQGKLVRGNSTEALPPEKGVMRDPYGNPGDSIGRSGNDGRRNDLVGQLNELQQAGARPDLKTIESSIPDDGLILDKMRYGKNELLFIAELGNSPGADPLKIAEKYNIADPLKVLHKLRSLSGELKQPLALTLGFENAAALTETIIKGVKKITPAYGSRAPSEKKSADTLNDTSAVLKTDKKKPDEIKGRPLSLRDFDDELTPAGMKAFSYLRYHLHDTLQAFDTAIAAYGEKEHLTRTEIMSILEALYDFIPNKILLSAEKDALAKEMGFADYNELKTRLKTLLKKTDGPIFDSKEDIHFLRRAVDIRNNIVGVHGSLGIIASGLGIKKSLVKTRLLELKKRYLTLNSDERTQAAKEIGVERAELEKALRLDKNFDEAASDLGLEITEWHKRDLSAFFYSVKRIQEKLFSGELESTAAAVEKEFQISLHNNKISNFLNLLRQFKENELTDKDGRPITNLIDIYNYLAENGVNMATYRLPIELGGRRHLFDFLTSDYFEKQKDPGKNTPEGSEPQDKSSRNNTAEAFPFEAALAPLKSFAESKPTTAEDIDLHLHRCNLALAEILYDYESKKISEDAARILFLEFVNSYFPSAFEKFASLTGAEKLRAAGLLKSVELLEEMPERVKQSEEFKKLLSAVKKHLSEQSTRGENEKTAEARGESKQSAKEEKLDAYARSKDAELASASALFGKRDQLEEKMRQAASRQAESGGNIKFYMNENLEVAVMNMATSNLSKKDAAKLSLLAKQFSENSRQIRALLDKVQNGRPKDSPDLSSREEQKIDDIIFAGMTGNSRQESREILKKLPPEVVDLLHEDGWLLILTDGIEVFGKNFLRDEDSAICDESAKLIIIDNSSLKMNRAAFVSRVILRPFLGEMDKLNKLKGIIREVNSPEGLAYHEVSHAILNNKGLRKKTEAAQKELVNYLNENPQLRGQYIEKRRKMQEAGKPLVPCSNNQEEAFSIDSENFIHEFFAEYFGRFLSKYNPEKPLDGQAFDNLFFDNDPRVNAIMLKFYQALREKNSSPENGAPAPSTTMPQGKLVRGEGIGKEMDPEPTDPLYPQTGPGKPAPFSWFKTSSTNDMDGLLSFNYKRLKNSFTSMALCKGVLQDLILSIRNADLTKAQRERISEALNELRKNPDEFWQNNIIFPLIGQIVSILELSEFKDKNKQILIRLNDIESAEALETLIKASKIKIKPANLIRNLARLINTGKIVGYQNEGKEIDEIMDDFARKYGFENLDALKTKLDNLNKQFESRAASPAPVKPNPEFSNEEIEFLYLYVKASGNIVSVKGETSVSKSAELFESIKEKYALLDDDGKQKLLGAVTSVKTLDELNRILTSDPKIFNDIQQSILNELKNLYNPSTGYARYKDNSVIEIAAQQCGIGYETANTRIWHARLIYNGLSDNLKETAAEELGVTRAMFENILNLRDKTSPVEETELIKSETADETVTPPQDTTPVPAPEIAPETSEKNMPKKGLFLKALAKELIAGNGTTDKSIAQIAKSVDASESTGHAATTEFRKNPEQAAKEYGLTPEECEAIKQPRNPGSISSARKKSGATPPEKPPEILPEKPENYKNKTMALKSGEKVTITWEEEWVLIKLKNRSKSLEYENLDNLTGGALTDIYTIITTFLTEGMISAFFDKMVAIDNYTGANRNFSETFGLKAKSMRVLLSSTEDYLETKGIEEDSGELKSKTKKTKKPETTAEPEASVNKPAQHELIRGRGIGNGKNLPPERPLSAVDFENPASHRAPFSQFASEPGKEPTENSPASGAKKVTIEVKDGGIVFKADKDYIALSKQESELLGSLDASRLPYAEALLGVFNVDSKHLLEKLSKINADEEYKKAFHGKFGFESDELENVLRPEEVKTPEKQETKQTPDPEKKLYSVSNYTGVEYQTPEGEKFTISAHEILKLQIYYDSAKIYSARAKIISAATNTFNKSVTQKTSSGGMEISIEDIKLRCRALPLDAQKGLAAQLGITGINEFNKLIVPEFRTNLWSTESDFRKKSGSDTLPMNAKPGEGKWASNAPKPDATNNDPKKQLPPRQERENTSQNPTQGDLIRGGIGRINPNLPPEALPRNPVNNAIETDRTKQHPFSQPAVEVKPTEQQLRRIKIIESLLKSGGQREDAARELGYVKGATVDYHAKIILQLPPEEREYYARVINSGRTPEEQITAQDIEKACGSRNWHKGITPEQVIWALSACKNQKSAAEKLIVTPQSLKPHIENFRAMKDEELRALIEKTNNTYETKISLKAIRDACLTEEEIRRNNAARMINSFIFTSNKTDVSRSLDRSKTGINQYIKSKNDLKDEEALAIAEVINKDYPETVEKLGRTVTARDVKWICSNNLQELMQVLIKRMNNLNEDTWQIYENRYEVPLDLFLMQLATLGNKAYYLKEHSPEELSGLINKLTKINAEKTAALSKKTGIENPGLSFNQNELGFIRVLSQKSDTTLDINNLALEYKISPGRAAEILEALPKLSPADKDAVKETAGFGFDNFNNVETNITRWENKNNGHKQNGGGGKKEVNEKNTAVNNGVKITMHRQTALISLKTVVNNMLNEIKPGFTGHSLNPVSTFLKYFNDRKDPAAVLKELMTLWESLGQDELKEAGVVTIIDMYNYIVLTKKVSLDFRYIGIATTGIELNGNGKYFNFLTYDFFAGLKTNAEGKLEQVNIKTPNGGNNTNTGDGNITIAPGVQYEKTEQVLVKKSAVAIAAGDSSAQWSSLLEERTKTNGAFAKVFPASEWNIKDFEKRTYSSPEEAKEVQEQILGVHRREKIWNNYDISGLKNSGAEWKNLLDSSVDENFGENFPITARYMSLLKKITADIEYFSDGAPDKGENLKKILLEMHNQEKLRKNEKTSEENFNVIQVKLRLALLKECIANASALIPRIENFSGSFDEKIRLFNLAYAENWLAKDLFNTLDSGKLEHLYAFMDNAEKCLNSIEKNIDSLNFLSVSLYGEIIKPEDYPGVDKQHLENITKLLRGWVPPNFILRGAVEALIAMPPHLIANLTEAGRSITFYPLNRAAYEGFGGIKELGSAKGSRAFVSNADSEITHHEAAHIIKTTLINIYKTDRYFNTWWTQFEAIFNERQLGAEKLRAGGRKAEGITSYLAVISPNGKLKNMLFVPEELETKFGKFSKVNEFFADIAKLYYNGKLKELDPRMYQLFNDLHEYYGGRPPKAEDLSTANYTKPGLKPRIIPAEAEDTALFTRPTPPSPWNKLKEFAGSIRKTNAEKIDLGDLLERWKTESDFENDYPETSAILAKYQNKNLEARQMPDKKECDAAIDSLIKEYEDKAVKKYREEKSAKSSQQPALTRGGIGAMMDEEPPNPELGKPLGKADLHTEKPIMSKTEKANLIAVLQDESRTPEERQNELNIVMTKIYDEKIAPLFEEYSILREAPENKALIAKILAKVLNAEGISVEDLAKMSPDQQIEAIGINNIDKAKKIFFSQLAGELKPVIDQCQKLYIELREKLNGQNLSAEEKLIDDLIFGPTPESARKLLRNMLKKLSPDLIMLLNQSGVLITNRKMSGTKAGGYDPILRIVNINRRYENGALVIPELAFFHETFHAVCENAETFKLVKEPFNAAKAEIRALVEELDAGGKPCSDELSALINGFRNEEFTGKLLGKPGSDEYYRHLTIEITGTLFAVLCENGTLSNESSFPAEKRLYESVEKIYMTLTGKKQLEKAEKTAPPKQPTPPAASTGRTIGRDMPAGPHDPEFGKLLSKAEENLDKINRKIRGLYQDKLEKLLRKNEDLLNTYTEPSQELQETLILKEELLKAVNARIIPAKLLKTINKILGTSLNTTNLQDQQTLKKTFRLLAKHTRKLTDKLKNLETEEVNLQKQIRALIDEAQNLYIELRGSLQSNEFFFATKNGELLDNMIFGTTSRVFRRRLSVLAEKLPQKLLEDLNNGGLLIIINEKNSSVYGTCYDPEGNYAVINNILADENIEHCFEQLPFHEIFHAAINNKTVFARIENTYMDIIKFLRKERAAIKNKTGKNKFLRGLFVNLEKSYGKNGQNSSSDDFYEDAAAHLFMIYFCGDLQYAHGQASFKEENTNLFDLMEKMRNELSGK